MPEEEISWAKLALERGLGNEVIKYLYFLGE